MIGNSVGLGRKLRGGTVYGEGFSLELFQKRAGDVCSREKVEARVGFEPTNGGFADQSWNSILLVRLALTSAHLADFGPDLGPIVPKLFLIFRMNPFSEKALPCKSGELLKLNSARPKSLQVDSPHSTSCRFKAMRTPLTRITL